MHDRCRCRQPVAGCRRTGRRRQPPTSSSESRVRCRSAASSGIVAPVVDAVVGRRRRHSDRVGGSPTCSASTTPCSRSAGASTRPIADVADGLGGTGPAIQLRAAQRLDLAIGHVAARRSRITRRAGRRRDRRYTVAAPSGPVPGRLRSRAHRRPSTPPADGSHRAVGDRGSHSSRWASAAPADLLPTGPGGAGPGAWVLVALGLVVAYRAWVRRTGTGRRAPPAAPLYATDVSPD